MPEPITTIDLGQSTVIEGIVTSMNHLVAEVRTRTTCDGCSKHLLDQAEADLKTIVDLDLADAYDLSEQALAILEEWEGRAHEVGLIGYASEGWYYIEEQS